MELHRDKPGMVGNLDDFDQASVGTRADHVHPPVGKLLPIVVVELIAVAMTLGNRLLAIARQRFTVSSQNGWLRPQELLLHPDGSVELIRRAETTDDLLATLRFEPKVLKRNR